MVEFLARHKQASSLKRLIFDDNSDFILQLLSSCNLLAIWSAPVKVGASALTLAVKQAFFHGPRPDRSQTR
jgi:hypothetical protein